MECPSCRAPNEDDAAECFTCGSTLAGTAPIKQGDTIGGRYVVRARLGRGGMGTVYRAQDTALEEEVALKVMAAGTAVDPELAKRFRSEIRLARQIAHRNVCRIYEYGEEAGHRFISMELIDGTDVRRLLRDRGPLPAAEAYDIAIQVARGLEAIHEAGIVHRDLKTPNIMRDGQGRVKVMDFGIAKRFDRDAASTGVTATGHVIGTPDYMSPEQARAEKVDFRSDIYALGVVIFELFTGELPFRAETPMAVLLKHLHEPPPLDGVAGSRLPPAVRRVLRRALAKPPGERHGSMAELISDLERARAETSGRGPVVARAEVVLGSAVPVTDEAPSPEPAPTATAQQAPAPAATETHASPTDPGARERATATIEEASRTPLLRARRRRVLVAGLAIAVSTALAAGLALWTRPRDRPAEEPRTPPTPIVVSINALPWANVRLTAVAGQALAVPTLRGDDGVTPLTVLLAPGDYDLELDNGGITPVRRERLQVRAGQANAFAFVMPGYDPEAAAEAAR